jgi:hypothetical protein
MNSGKLYENSGFTCMASNSAGEIFPNKTLSRGITRVKFRTPKIMVNKVKKLYGIACLAIGRQ